MTVIADFAVFLSGLADLFKNSFIMLVCPHFNDLFKWRQSKMQAVVSSFHNIFVAFPASFVCFRKGGVSNDTSVSGLPIRISGIPVMASLASDFSMRGF